MSTNIWNFTTRVLLVLWSIRCLNAYNKVCTQSEKCNGTITCAADEDCSIDCNGYESCLGATINCPSGAYKCDLNCYYTFACDSTTVNAAQTSGSNLTITAEGRWVLRSSMITCPQTGNCVINFVGSSTLDGTFSKIADNSVIDASNTVSGNLEVTLSTTLDSNNALGDNANMKIYCPLNGECLVDCGEGGSGKCAGVNVEAQDTTTLLTVTGDGNYIFNSMSVICPRKNGNTPNCIIMSEGNYTEPYYNFKIRSFESFTNVDITCGNYDNCINSDALPHMWCNEDFTIWCMMVLNSNDMFECKYDNPCQNWVAETRNCIDNLDKLWAGFAIYSLNGNVKLVVQDDGNLCLYTKDGDINWIERFCSYTSVTSTSSYYLNIENGNLKLHNFAQILFQTNTTTGNTLCVEDCGMAYLYDANGGIAWASEYTNNVGTGGYPFCTGCVSNSIDTNYNIAAGTALYSSDYKVRFNIQTDGNICLYTNDGTGGTWTERFCTYTLTGVGGDKYYLSIQTDGNMVLYDGSDIEKWRANITGQGQAPIELCVDNCGYAYLKDVNDNILWYSAYINNIAIGNYPTCTQPPTTTEEEYSTTRIVSTKESIGDTIDNTESNESNANNAMFIGVFAVVTFYLM